MVAVTVRNTFSVTVLPGIVVWIVLVTVKVVWVRVEVTAATAPRAAVAATSLFSAAAVGLDTTASCCQPWPGPKTWQLGPMQNEFDGAGEGDPLPG